jgi:hypothetical protein
MRLSVYALVVTAGGSQKCVYPGWLARLLEHCSVQLSQCFIVKLKLLSFFAVAVHDRKPTESVHVAPSGHLRP